MFHMRFCKGSKLVDNDLRPFESTDGFMHLISNTTILTTLC